MRLEFISTAGLMARSFLVSSSTAWMEQPRISISSSEPLGRSTSGMVMVRVRKTGLNYLHGLILEVAEGIAWGSSEKASKGSDRVGNARLIDDWSCKRL